MADRLNIAIAQINPVSGALVANANAILAARDQFPAADLLVTPALALDGGATGTLAARPAFRRAIDSELQRLARATANAGPAILVGHSADAGGGSISSATLLQQGEIRATLSAGTGCLTLHGRVLGVNTGTPLTPNTTQALRDAGAQLLIHMACQAWTADTAPASQILQDIARHSSLPALWVNRAGAQDELVFAGGSLAAQANGRIMARLPEWEAATAAWSFHSDSGFAESAIAPADDSEQALYHAMLVGLRDYVDKSGFPGVLIGLSGGLDSALTAAIAVDALGADKVWCVMLPSRFTSAASIADAMDCARLLGTRLDEIAIEPAVSALDSMLQPHFAGTVRNLAEENIQARLRMVALMALSNKFGHMMLTTDNKSEAAVGYSTLYGDCAGGFGVLGDLYKSDAFRLARWRNGNRPRLALGPDGPVIPERIITKPPTAELRDNQRDDDSLPPYDVLDPILHALIEEDLSVPEIVARGLADAVTAARVEQLLTMAEYKRRQSPPSVRLSRHAFAGRDYPITNGFRTSD